MDKEPSQEAQTGTQPSDSLDCKRDGDMSWVCILLFLFQYTNVYGDIEARYKDQDMDLIPVYTSPDGSACGVDLNLTETYLLQGECIFLANIMRKDGVLSASPFSFTKENPSVIWDSPICYHSRSQ